MSISRPISGRATRKAKTQTRSSVSKHCCAERPLRDSNIFRLRDSDGVWRLYMRDPLQTMANDAFEEAIDRGDMSTDPSAANWVGRFIWKGRRGGQDVFELREAADDAR